MRFHLSPLSLTWSDLERSQRGLPINRTTNQKIRKFGMANQSQPLSLTPERSVFSGSRRVALAETTGTTVYLLNSSDSMLAAGWSLVAMLAAGWSPVAMLAAGWSLVALLAAGWSLVAMLAAGWSLVAMLAAGWSLVAMYLMHGVSQDPSPAL